MGFGAVIASCWILFADYVAYGEGKFSHSYNLLSVRCLSKWKGGLLYEYMLDTFCCCFCWKQKSIQHIFVPQTAFSFFFIETLRQV
jgi:hypothetical protein